MRKAFATLEELDKFEVRLGLAMSDLQYDPTKFSIATGDDAVLDDIFSYQIYNKIKNHWYASSEPSDKQAGMMWIDSDDDKARLYDGAAWNEIGLALLDEDDMASDSATQPSSQQSIKAFIENQNLANLIKNGSFESWSLGTANQAPDGWTKIGTPTDVSRDTGDRDNFGAPYAAKITSNGSGNEGLTVTFSNLKASKKYIVIARVKATGGDTAKIWTTGGSSNLSETTTSASWVTLSGTFTTDGTPTNIVLKIGSDNATDIVWFDAIIVLEGEAIKQFSPHPNDQHLKAIDYQSTAPANFDYGLLRMECGRVTLTGGGGGSATVTFGTAFSKILTVACVVYSSGPMYYWNTSTMTTTGFAMAIRDTNVAIPAGNEDFLWIAIGVGP